MLFEQAQALAAECKDDDDSSTLHEYIGLIQSTRSTIEEDPELDRRLVVAASNAISIISYAHTCGLIPRGLSHFRDFSYCRVPYSNFNTSVLYRCSFDHADLSEATFFQTDLRCSSFKHANLRHATTYCHEFSHRAHSMFGLWGTACVAPDESEFACVSGMPGVSGLWIWDSKTMDLRRHLRLPNALQVTSLTYSPDAQHIAIAGATSHAYILNASSAEVVLELGPHDRSVQCVAYHPDGVHIATGTASGTMYFWDASSAPPRCTWSVTNRAESWMMTGISETVIIKFSLDGTKVADITQVGSVRVLECATGTVQHIWKLPGDPVAGLEFSRDGCFLAMHVGKHFEIRDLHSGQAVMTVPTLETFAQVFDTSLPGINSESVFTQCEVRGINVWKLPQLFGYLASLSDGQRFVSTESIDDATAVAWVGNLPAHVEQTFTTREPVEWFCLHPEGAFIACQTDSGLSIRDLDFYKLLASMEFVEVKKSLGSVTISYARFPRGLEMSHDGRRIVCYGNGWAYVIDSTLCKITHEFIDPQSYPPSPDETQHAQTFCLPLGYDFLIAISSDGDKIAMTTRPSHNNSVTLFDLGCNAQTAVFTIGPDEGAISEVLRCLRFSNDDTKLAGVRKNGSIIVWDVSSQAVVYEGNTDLEEGRFSPFIAFAPDNTLVATVGPGDSINIWDLCESMPKRSLKGLPDAPHCVLWSSDSRFLISGGWDGIRFWDTDSWNCVYHCTTTQSACSVALAMHDTLLVTLDANHLLMFWKLSLPSTKSETPSSDGASIVDLQLEQVRWCPLSTRCFALLGDFEGAEVGGSFQRSIENAATTLRSFDRADKQESGAEQDSGDKQDSGSGQNFSGQEEC